MRNLESIFGGTAVKPAKPSKPALDTDAHKSASSGRYITLSIPEDTRKAVLECQTKLMASGRRMKKYQIVGTALEQYKKSL